MNSKLEWMWKEAFLVGLLSQLLPGGAEGILLCRQTSRSAGPDLKTERRGPCWSVARKRRKETRGKEREETTVNAWQAK